MPKLIAATILLSMATSVTSSANEKALEREDRRIAEYCGAGHINEIASDDDIRSNPDGFFVTSLGEQLSLGDARVILTNEDDPYLCTRPSATPDMDATQAALNKDKRIVRWLFVKSHPIGN